ncbi:MAG: ribonucleoside-diphosphate reductase subunit alpha [Gammaproteobacteria bacterium]|nr:MAG: ribonucleoside-diphosphate reductase subunit alpha [Gammaproteobacteria bacterium]
MENTFSPSTTNEEITKHMTENASKIVQSSAAPGGMKVIRRNGMVTPYDDSKINVAITKAFLAVEGGNAATSSRVHEISANLTKDISNAFARRMIDGGTVHIEDIQDQVELVLMRAGEHKIARAYVLYREARSLQRSQKVHQVMEELPGGEILVVQEDGSSAPLDIQRIHTVVNEACENLTDIDPTHIIEETIRNLYDGVSLNDVSTALVMTARTMIENDPNYTYVTARLLMDNVRSSALKMLGIAEQATQHEMEVLYPKALSIYLKKAVELELVSPELLTFDLDKLSAALVAERDTLFTYLGIQTLFDRYFIHHDETRFELPQIFFMRVAMGLCIAEEENREERAIEFYNQISSFDYMCSTPTLFNSGTLRSQLSSCYLTTVPDNLSGIYGAIHDNAMLSKYAGGLGNDWTPVRSLGAHIKGTNGKSQGVVPFLKVANDTAVAVNQGGKRKGAVCAYLETWHLDIEEFLELRKNTGDDRRRTHDMNSANWVPDLFLKRVSENQEWTLFSPHEAPELHDLYGRAFEKKYIAYEGMARRGELRNFKIIKANDLWRKMLSMLFETGHPWITFKDPCNLRSPQQHTGVVHSSNLCTEITLNTSSEEIAVCNLGSVNLVKHMKDGKLDLEKLEKTVTTAIRMLDNVIDINFYPVPQAKTSNTRHRPIGMGLMGFQDALYLQKIPYASDEAVTFADQSMEAISYFAIKASSDLAAERGSYSSYEGSLWSQGIFPVDSLKKVEEERGAKYCMFNTDETLDWKTLRAQVKSTGIRNSNIMAIAPTATIANITGVSQSVEPTYQNMYVKSNLSGEFTVVNPYMVKELKEIGLWDNVMINDLKYYDGSLLPIDRIPDELKSLFATAFELDGSWIVEAAARRQKWIDQAQSLNIYVGNPSGKKLDTLYRMCWMLGLKTTYYLRSLGATTNEKSTDKENLSKADLSGQPAPVPKACAIDEPDCEACQ